MPTPESPTISRSSRSLATTRTVIAPASVNLYAFEIRLRTIFSHIDRSMKTGDVDGLSMTSPTPARSASVWNALASSVVRTPTSVG